MNPRGGITHPREATSLVLAHRIRKTPRHASGVAHFPTALRALFSKHLREA
jgi:hypothetical protein